MESHPTYPALNGDIQKYPHAASAVFQTYNDLLLVQQWTELELVDLPTCERCGFQGHRPENKNSLAYVVPCSLAESLSMSWLKSAFSGFGHVGELFLAINAEDSSIVYYKLSMGITKPPL
ncbi:tRNA intron endonuclease [Lactarius quietus]|nr:tRNA intron endonuclease [Lactarius quietus]